MEMLFGDAYRNSMHNLFKRRYEAAFAVNFVLALFMAAFTGVAAQFRIYLPFTPVPITGQVLPALLSGMFLGKWYGGLSQGLYAAIGAAGVPWFAPKTGMPAFTNGGFDVLIGVTGGYIVGFAVAAFIVGWFTDNFVRARSSRFQLPLMLFGVVVIYTLGAIQFSFVTGNNLANTLMKAVLPFIPGDVFKALAAVAIGRAVLPRQPYATELDAGATKREGERKLYTAGAAISGLVALVFLALFWLKVSTMSAPTFAQLVSASAIYGGVILASGALMIHFFNGRKSIAL